VVRVWMSWSFMLPGEWFRLDPLFWPLEMVARHLGKSEGQVTCRTFTMSF
jgi:hypothetical protein